MIAGVAAALSIAGTGIGAYGSYKSFEAQKDAETARKNQMRVEAARARRLQVQEAMKARAMAVATATNQGAGQSSALVGATAGIAGQAGRNLLAITQDEKLSKNVFSANRRDATGQSISAFGSGLTSLGGAVSNNAGTLTRLGFG